MSGEMALRDFEAEVKPLAIDLFCGLGGWSEGLIAAGYKVVGFDIERHSTQVEVFAVPDGDGWRTASTRPVYYLAQLVIQDVLTLHGSQFRDATVIVASPPCQNYSYLAMPWSRSRPVPCEECNAQGFIDGSVCPHCDEGAVDNSKAAKALRRKWETEGPDNRLFDACFRIQREACYAKRLQIGCCDLDFQISACPRCHIPLIVENVRGAQPWVGKSRANYGSFYLWGDVEQIGNRIQVGVDIGRFGAGLRIPGKSGRKLPGNNGPRMWSNREVQRLCDAPLDGQKRNLDGTDHPQGSWFAIADSSQGDRRGVKVPGQKNGTEYAFTRTGAHGQTVLGTREGMKTVGHVNKRDGHGHTRHLTNQAESDAVTGTKIGGDWFSDPNSTCRKHGSRSNARKAASAMIAKIPLPLSSYIAGALRPA